MRKGAAGRLKGCGLKAGMPDILVFCTGITVGIELKTEDGTVSTEQRKTFDALREAQIPVHICYSIDDVYKILSDIFGFPMRPYNYGYPLGHKNTETGCASQPDEGTPAPQEKINAPA